MAKEVEDAKQWELDQGLNICPVCEREFKSINGVRTHSATAHPDIEKDELFCMMRERQLRENQ